MRTSTSKRKIATKRKASKRTDRITTEHIGSFHQFGLFLPTRTVQMGMGELDLMGTGGSGEVDRESVLQVIRNLNILHTIDAEAPIHLLLNTPGGDVDQGLALYDYIRALPNPVAITVLGPCMSMGAVILQAADVRLMLPHAVLMVHEGSMTLSGEVKEVHSAMRYYSQTGVSMDTALLERIHEKHPGYELDKFKKLIADDLYLTAHQAVEMGLADGVIGERSVETK